MSGLTIYFNENCIVKNRNKDLKIIFQCSESVPNEYYNPINLLINEYPIEIREKVWFWYNEYTLQNLNQTLNSKINWINEKLKFSIIASRFNSGNFIDGDLTNLIKILSILVWSKNKKIKSVKFYGFDKNLQSSIKQLFDFYKISTLIIFNPVSKKKLLSNIQLDKIKVFGSMIKLLIKFILKTKSKNLKKNTIPDYLFIDYLFNLDEKLESKYWGQLPNILKDNKSIEIWHIFVHSKETSSIFEASELVKKLNIKDNKNNIIHRLIDTEMSMKDLFLAYLDLFFIIYYFLRKKNKSIISSLIKTDLSKSFCSGELLNSLLYKNFFNRVLPNDLSRTSIIYVGENLSWEKSLSHISLNKGCRHSIFSIQTSLRFWDMRFYKPFINKKNKTFFPALIACNSKYSYLELSKQLPKKNITIVENNRTFSDKKIFKKSIRSHHSKYIWLIGESSQRKTEKLFNFILRSDYLKKGFKLTFRPHPSDSGMFYKTNRNKFSKILNHEDYRNEDLIIGDSTSSYLLECYLIGRKVIAFSKDCELDYSAFYMTKLKPQIFSNLSEFNNLLNESKKIINPLNKNTIYHFYEKNINYSKWISQFSDNA